jgi:hypothetical protein
MAETQSEYRIETTLHTVTYLPLNFPVDLLSGNTVMITRTQVNIQYMSYY